MPPDKQAQTNAEQVKQRAAKEGLQEKHSRTIFTFMTMVTMLKHCGTLFSDLRFVYKFTGLDFSAQNFTH